MIEPQVATRDLEAWASILLDHSLGGIVPEDRVMIKGERICWPLMEVLERRVLQAGAIPDVLLVPPNNDRGRVWSATAARHATPEQLARVPDWHRARYESFTKYVEVLGAEDVSRFAGLEAAQLQGLAATDRPFADVRISKRWVITLYPTPAMAASEGIALDEYASFVVGASTTDPRPLRDAEERLAPRFREGRTAIVVTGAPDGRELTLALDIGPCLPALSYGLRNVPDGEIYTSPVASETEGEIFLDLPSAYSGNEIRGIFLRFERGRIVDYHAELGHEHLRAIVETDEGSHRLGELALGMNPGLTRCLKHPLFVEKVGGTLHVAIGASYDNCYVEDTASDKGKKRIAELVAAGVVNRSAQHVDLVADFRPGGCGRRVLIDDRELVVRDGLWVEALPSA
jgi:aminopeptidase